jgi:hypothetical protein
LLFALHHPGSDERWKLEVLRTNLLAHGILGELRPARILNADDRSEHRGDPQGLENALATVAASA